MATERTNCPNCGAVKEPEANRCPNCGTYYQKDIHVAATVATYEPDTVCRGGSKQMASDNLALDALAARRAGMSYGAYKALHPETRAANESGPQSKKQQTTTRRVYEFFCRSCGNKFTTTNKKRRYCCDDCKIRRDSAHYRALNKAKKEEKHD